MKTVLAFAVLGLLCFGHFSRPGQIETQDWRTGERVTIGSQTEDFNDAVEDVRAYIDWAER